MECDFIGYCDNGRIKTSGVSVNNSSNASGGKKKKKKKVISSNGVFRSICPPSLFCGDTCLGESHKIGEVDSASLLDACQPVQRMTENGRQQRGDGTFDSNLIANFWLMRGKGSSPKLSSRQWQIIKNTIFFFSFVWSLHSAQLIKPRRSDWNRSDRPVPASALGFKGGSLRRQG